MCRRASTVVVVLLIVVRAAAAAPFRNGSFEQSSIPNLGIGQTLGPGSTAIDGWTVGGTGIDYVGTLWQAADGGRSLDLLANTAGGEIYQDFETVAGGRYEVRYFLSVNPDGGPEFRRMRAGALDALTLNSLSNNGLSYSVPDATRSDMLWFDWGFRFTAASSLTRLWFRDDSASGTVFYGSALDNVSVMALPEPSSLLLIGSGLAAVLARRRLRIRGPGYRSRISGTAGGIGTGRPNSSRTSDVPR